VSRLTRKLGRDLLRMKGQVFTIALVLGCGVMAMIMMRSTHESLVRSRDAYYLEYRFGDVFARLERAPESVRARLERIPGVARVYTRVVEEVMVPIATMPEPVAGRIVSIPDDGVPPLNALHLRSGRLPDPAVPDEAVLLEQFARAHRLGPGDQVPAVLNGSLRQLRVVGVALSPEYVFAISGHELIADDERFAVFWMNRDLVAPVFQMEGAFNDVTLSLEPGASETAVLDAVDRELAPYGGFHAVARDRQQSNHALRSELEQLGNLALVIPAIFLAVAAFLVNVVVSRLVFLERTQIAVLKALGFGDGRIAMHYLGLVAVIVAIGGALGIASGIWAATWMTDLYTNFFRFPDRVYHLSASLVALSVGIGLAAAVVGAVGSVRRVARLPPAQAMRPPAPLRYHRTLFERLGFGRLVGTAPVMVAREITRRPLRFGLSVLGIAMGVAIFVMGRFSWDSFEYVMDDIFLREHREDLIVAFTDPRPERAIGELAAVPGVIAAEGQRAVPARVRARSRARDVVLLGIDADSELRQILGDAPRPHELPDSGVLVTDRLAALLGVRVGDTIDAELLEGEWPVRQVTVAGLVSDPFGLQVYARREIVDQLLREEPRVTGALLRVDPARSGAVRERLKEMPRVLSVVRRDTVIENYRQQTGESTFVITLILTLSAAAIAIGVVYNNARIALSMRSRDLASLRVLGFTRGEISGILLGELALQVLLGIPLGLLLGTLWASWYIDGLHPEMFGLPLHITAQTYAAAAGIALASGVVSALLVRRKLDQLDLVGVLKISE
jgi:putative ABC transport system permease protein